MATAPMEKKAIMQKLMAMAQKAAPAAKSMGSKVLSGAKDFGVGVGQGALQVAKLPFNGLKDFTAGISQGPSTAKALGRGVGVGGAGIGALKLPGMYGQYKQNQGLEQGKSEGMAQALAQIQGQQKDRGYLGTLLDALMNKQQGAGLQ